jgi:hypothetical protein
VTTPVASLIVNVPPPQFVPFSSTLLQTDGTRPTATLRAAPHLEQLAVTRNEYTVFRTA